MFELVITILMVLVWVFLITLQLQIYDMKTEEKMRREGRYYYDDHS